MVDDRIAIEQLAPGTRVDLGLLLSRRLQQRALATVHRLNSDTPKEEWLHAINDSGMYYWNRCLRSLNEASALKISDPLKHRTGMLIQYCNLRVQAYAYYSRRIAGSVPAGEDSLQYYNSQIFDLMDRLKKDK